MPDVSSLAEAVAVRVVVYQLFIPMDPEASVVICGAAVSNQKDLVEATVCPALSRARKFTSCLPSVRGSTPEEGKAFQLPLSKLYSKTDKPEPGEKSEAEALSVAVVYQVFAPNMPLMEA